MREESTDAANVLRIEVSKRNPSEHDERGNLIVTHTTRSRSEAKKHALFCLQRGYWVEIYDDASGELLAGPLDPDERLPATLSF
jgi:hypothetical protein